MRDRSILEVARSDNRKFRLVRDIYYQDYIDKAHNLITTNVFCECCYKVQIKILGFWWDVKTYKSYDENIASQMYIPAIRTFRHLTD